MPRHLHYTPAHLASRRRCLATSASSTSTPSPPCTASSTPTGLVQVGRRRDARVALRPEGRVVVDDTLHGVCVVDGAVSTPVAASAASSTTEAILLLSVGRRRSVRLLLGKTATAARSKVAAGSAVLLGTSKGSTVGAAQRSGLVGWAELLAWRAVTVGGV
jgi:hypothetical protein